MSSYSTGLSGGGAQLEEAVEGGHAFEENTLPLALPPSPHLLSSTTPFHRGPGHSALPQTQSNGGRLPQVAM